jgi:hypothetical protein
MIASGLSIATPSWVNDPVGRLPFIEATGSITSGGHGNWYGCQLILEHNRLDFD